MNGSKPKKIATVPRIITSVSPLKNGDILISGRSGKYVGTNGKLKENWSYETEGEKVYEYYWLLKNGSSTPEKIDGAQYSKLASLAQNTDGRFYTKELPSGEANIFFETLEDPQPKKVGHLTKNTCLV